MSFLGLGFNLWLFWLINTEVVVAVCEAHGASQTATSFYAFFPVADAIL